MKQAQIAAVRCGDYDEATVDSAVRGLLAHLGGMGRFVKPGMRVYIKPNLLGKHLPSEAVTTHPEVTAAVARLAYEAGAAEVLIGDCPGGAASDERVAEVYRVTGYAVMAKQVGARMVVNKTRSVRSVPGGVSAQSVELAAEMLGADLIVNIAKAKTHQLCAFTGAVKNLYGAVCGWDKKRFHAVYAKAIAFNHFLIDIAEAVKPALNIIDAVVGVEGPGPAAGYPRKLGALLASENPYALDAAAVYLIGWKQDDVPLLVLARQRGLLPGSLSDIEALGDELDKLRLKKPFLKPTMTAQAALRLTRLLPRPIRDAVQARPVVLMDHCVGCAECAAACPPHAIVMRGRKAVIDHAKCIKCFCCQELCPAKALEVKKGFYK